MHGREESQTHYLSSVPCKVSSMWVWGTGRLVCEGRCRLSGVTAMLFSWYKLGKKVHRFVKSEQINKNMHYAANKIKIKCENYGVYLMIVIESIWQ